ELCFCHRWPEAGVRDFDPCSDRHGVEEPGNVLRTHPDATVAGRPTDQPFLRRAVDVNVACESQGVLLFQTAQPENSAHDRIAAGSVGAEDFASRPAILEYRAERSVRAD